MSIIIKYCTNNLFLFVGLDEQGLYRVGGVSSKITKLLAMGLDRRKTTNGLNSLSFLDDCIEWETKTITSALKLFLRNLPEPLMTFKYHNAFISAASKILSFLLLIYLICAFKFTYFLHEPFRTRIEVETNK